MSAAECAGEVHRELEAQLAELQQVGGWALGSGGAHAGGGRLAGEAAPRPHRERDGPTGSLAVGLLQEGDRRRRGGGGLESPGWPVG